MSLAVSAQATTGEQEGLHSVNVTLKTYERETTCRRRRGGRGEEENFSMYT
jgi:hypothetical protein